MKMEFDDIASRCPCSRTARDHHDNHYQACSAMSNDGSVAYWRPCCYETCPLYEKQKPLTLLELEEACDDEYEDVIGSHIWLQDKKSKVIVAGVIDRNSHQELEIVWTSSPDGPEWYKLKLYGRTWVAWQLRPTKEERESVRWIE